jgi:hypothetical protein
MYLGTVYMYILTRSDFKYGRQMVILTWKTDFCIYRHKNNT